MPRILFSPPCRNSVLAFGLFVSLLLMSTHSVSAQCDPEVPLLYADLSTSATATYMSPAVQRAGNCCDTTDPDNCIQFEITLHPEAAGINFEICDGAVPPGALFYQIACGPQVAVGEIICLDGPGPHLLTFCKPGNNENVYCITSIPAPSAGPDVSSGEGCAASISCEGYDPSSINWTSVFPGAEGAYDYLLACPTCEVTQVDIPSPMIDYADFMVCGVSIGSCVEGDPHCDTVRVYFASDLALAITPDPPAICAGATAVDVEVAGSGGFPPYVFTWSNGDIGSVTSFTAPGTYSVSITDSNDCPPTEISFEVIEYALPLMANAGANQLICDLTNGIQLQGNFSGIEECLWVGGDGEYVPNDQTANAVYYPSEAEITAGEVSLTLELNPVGDCPGESDVVVFQIAPFEADVDIETSDVLCAGDLNGSISISASGPGAPYSTFWPDLSTSDAYLSNMGVGTYTVEVSDYAGCSESFDIVIIEPSPLEATVNQVTSPLCSPEEGGTISLQISGGTAPYSFLAEEFNGPGNYVIDNLGPGAYAAPLIDANGCQVPLEFEIDTIEEMSIQAEDEVVICPGDIAVLDALVTGGTAPYTYLWSNGLGNSATHEVSVPDDAFFSLFVIDANGCQTETITIQVVVIGMEPGQLVVTPELGICRGDSALLQAWHFGDHPPYEFQWNAMLPPTLGPHTVFPEVTTDYAITVTDQCGNQLTEVSTVVVHPDPVIAIPPSAIEGCAPVEVQLEDPFNTELGCVHTWSVNDGSILMGNPALFIAEEPGIYTLDLEVTSPVGCTAEGANLYTVTAFPYPEASFTATPWETDMDAPEVTFENISQGDVAQVEWLVNGESFLGLGLFTYTFENVGSYPVLLEVTSPWGCSDSILHYVRVDAVYDVIVPTAFTPLSTGTDGYYDPTDLSNIVFYPFAKYVEEFRMQIFNRWGELIFESDDIALGWDGLYRGQPSPQDVYVYKMEFTFTDGFELVKTGDVTLFR